jgi:hypothetical protein
LPELISFFAVGEGIKFVRISAARPIQATSRRVYYTIDWGGWMLLVVFSAIVLATGLTIRAGLYGAQYPAAGDVAMVIAGGIALLWAGFLFSFRVTSRAIITSDGLTIVHGAWRHQIPWTDVERVDEWSTMTDGMREHWMALWSIDGMRLQIRQDLVGNYAAFRTDVMRSLAGYQTPPDSVTDLEHPLVLIEDRAMQIGGWGTLAGVCGVSGLLIWGFLPHIASLGVVLAAAGGVSLVITAVLAIFRQKLIVGAMGVVSRRGIIHQHIPWGAMYGLTRDESYGTGGAAGILLRGLLMIFFRLDKRSGVILGPVRPYGTITVRGGSGERIFIHERRYLHPSWIRTRLRAEVASLRERAAPLASQVVPLPQTGKLKPDVALPPDPMEGSSTLWLRESAGNDPFRGGPLP